MYGEFDVMVFGFGDPFVKAEGIEDGDGGTADDGGPAEGDIGDAHGEAFEGGDAAAMGEGVEGDIDLAEGGHMFGPWGFAEEGNAARVDAGAREITKDAFPSRGIVKFRSFE